MTVSHQELDGLSEFLAHNLDALFSLGLVEKTLESLVVLVCPIVILAVVDWSVAGLLDQNIFCVYERSRAYLGRIIYLAHLLHTTSYVIAKPSSTSLDNTTAPITYP